MKTKRSDWKLFYKGCFINDLGGEISFKSGFASSAEADSAAKKTGWYLRLTRRHKKWVGPFKSAKLAMQFPTEPKRDTNKWRAYGRQRAINSQMGDGLNGLL